MFDRNNSVSRTMFRALEFGTAKKKSGVISQGTYKQIMTPTICCLLSSLFYYDYKIRVSGCLELIEQPIRSGHVPQKSVPHMGRDVTSVWYGIC